MTAATVPPPGWIPIGASELRANNRRFFTRAFTVSAAGHLAVLAAVLWLQAQAVEVEPRWIATPIHLAPPLLPPPPVLPNDFPTDPASGNEPKTGTLVPIDRVTRPDIPDPKGGVKTFGGGPTTGLPSFTPQPTDSGDRRDPEEGAYVAYDRPPVPYYLPTPDYPGWAREQGIQGRVVLHVLVGRDGRVIRITVWKDVVGLTGAARETVARWLFHPALSGKNAVAVWVEIPIDFRL